MKLLKLLAIFILFYGVACSAQSDLPSGGFVKATAADFMPLPEDTIITDYVKPRLIDSTEIADSIAWAKAGY